LKVQAHPAPGNNGSKNFLDEKKIGQVAPYVSVDEHKSVEDRRVVRNRRVRTDE